MPADEQPRSVLDVARGVLDELDLDRVIDRVLEAARELTGARYAALGVLGDRLELDRFITVGIDEDTRRAIGDLPRGHGVLGELIRNPVPLRLSSIGEHPRSYGCPRGHPRMQTFLGVPVLVAGAPYGSLYLTEKTAGAEFTDSDQQSVMTLAKFAGVAIDHARRYTDAAVRGEELARTVATLQATSEITRAVGGMTDLEAILEVVAKRGRALVSARALFIELVDHDGLVVAAAAGERPASVIGEHVALADSVASAALRTGTTQRLEDDLNRVRFDQHGLGRFGVNAEAGMVVPLVVHNQSYGVLIALDRLQEGSTFNVEDQALLEAFATSAANAVATASTAATELHIQRLAGAEGERGRWARELHDETLQSLAGVQISLSTGRRSGGVQALEGVVDQAAKTSRKRSRTSAHWSQTCAPQRWLTWASNLRSKRFANGRVATASRSTPRSISPTSRAAS
jgi:GAF domain-containing protein